MSPENMKAQYVKAFWTNLDAILKLKRISLTELTNYLGVGYASFASAKCRKDRVVDLRIKTVLGVCDFLNITIEELLFGHSNAIRQEKEKIENDINIDEIMGGKNSLQESIVPAMRYLTDKQQINVVNHILSFFNTDLKTIKTNAKELAKKYKMKEEKENETK